jgi:membrane protease YdiL (CAAX protease family)
MSKRPPLVAPVWHTAVLLLILFGIAAYGAYAQATSHASHQLVQHRGSALPLYLSLIAAEWGLLRFVVYGGLRRTNTSLRDLIGARWGGWRDVLRDVAIALLAWAGWSAVETLAAHALGPDSAKGIATLLPRSVPEIAVWVLLSLSAGFCEEVVFRGYLQRQFHALSGNAFLALVAQAVVFGVSHGYQGLRNVVVISVFGIVYGVLASWRRSLRPGMVLHAWTDVIGGLFPALG